MIGDLVKNLIFLKKEKFFEKKNIHKKTIQKKTFQLLIKLIFFISLQKFIEWRISS